MSIDIEPTPTAPATSHVVTTVVTRRTAIVAGAIGVGTVAVAACSGGGTTAGRTAGSAPKAAAGDPLVSLDSITVGDSVSATLRDGSKVLVSRPTAATAACFSAICTHQGCTVKPAGAEFHCPCHGSVYNATTGAVIHGPAPRPLPAVAVHVAGGQVVTGAAG